jgi:hypothetical protein
MSPSVGMYTCAKLTYPMKALCMHGQVTSGCSSEIQSEARKLTRV